MLQEVQRFPLTNHSQILLLALLTKQSFVDKEVAPNLFLTVIQSNALESILRSKLFYPCKSSFIGNIVFFVKINNGSRPVERRALRRPASAGADACRRRTEGRHGDAQQGPVEPPVFRRL